MTDKIKVIISNNQKAVRRTHIPPAPGRFRPYFHEEESPRQTHE